MFPAVRFPLAETNSYWLVFVSVGGKTWNYALRHERIDQIRNLGTTVYAPALPSISS